MGKVAVEDDAFELAESRRHRLEALPERLEYCVVALKLIVGEASLLQPWLQMSEVPPVERNLADVHLFELVAQVMRNELVVDGFARSSFEVAVLVPDVIRHPVGLGFGSDAVSRQPERRLHMPDGHTLLLFRRHEHQSSQVAHLRKVEPTKHRKTSEVHNSSVTRSPNSRRHKRSIRINPLIEMEPTKTGFFGRHARRTLRIISYR
ncbi:hypothetical protein D3C71_1599490 [compost metagenome]